MSRADSRRVPQEQIDSVVKALYADADRVGWEHLSPQRRTAMYDQWVTDPQVGGVLTEFMSAETARSWIKDGPMKEYGRARQGAGRYAKFGSTEDETGSKVVAHAIGRDALVVEGTIRVKPFQCVAQLGDRRTFVTWGEARNFRYLVWAALGYLADNASDTAVVVIVETMAAPTTASEKARHAAIASRCDIGLKYYRAPTPRRAPDSEDRT